MIGTCPVCKNRGELYQWQRLKNTENNDAYDESFEIEDTVLCRPCGERWADDPVRT